MLSKLKRGFTLIELLVVVLIIAILAAVALPQYQKAVERARAAEALTALKAVATAAEAYYLIHGQYPASINDLDITLPPLQNFDWISTAAYRGLRSKKKGYTLSYSFWQQSSSRRGRYICNLTYMSGYGLEDYDTDSLAGKICKSLCGTDTLIKVWGSNNPGCMI